MVGITDLNVSSNSDIGMSGSFVPWAKLYDGFFFTPEHQPCQNRYKMEQSLQDEEGFNRFPVHIGSFEDYLKSLENGDKFKDLLKYEKIEIIEKTAEELAKKSHRQNIEYSTLKNQTEDASADEENVDESEEDTDSEEEESDVEGTDS